jgi:phosphoribosylformylglycinamidine synthase
MPFREAGRSVVLIRATEPGDATDAESEFGSSDYAKDVLGAVWGYPPELDLEKEAALQKAIIELIHEGVVDSAHDCSEGGLTVTLAEKAFPNAVGLTATLASNGLPAEFVLFGEDASRIVVSCDPMNVPRIKQVAVKYGLFTDEVGKTGGERLEIELDGKTVVSASLAELNDVYETALEKALRTEPSAVAV